MLEALVMWRLSFGSEGASHCSYRAMRCLWPSEWAPERHVGLLVRRDYRTGILLKADGALLPLCAWMCCAVGRLSQKRGRVLLICSRPHIIAESYHAMAQSCGEGVV
jgi:hypothetical protein